MFYLEEPVVIERALLPRPAAQAAGVSTRRGAAGSPGPCRVRVNRAPPTHIHPEPHTVTLFCLELGSLQIQLVVMRSYWIREVP